MAKDTQDKQTKDMNGTPYRVNFTFVDNKFNLRQGSLIVPADTEDNAKRTAEIQLRERFGDQFRITKAIIW